MTSSDAVFDNWVIQSSDTTENLQAISADGPLLVAVGENATLITSSDFGVSWAAPTTVPDIGTNTLHNVIWSGTQYVVVGKRGKVLTSPDGITWVDRSGFEFNDLWAIHWDGSQYITAGRGGVIHTSVDAISWVQQNSVTNARLHAIAGNASHLVAVGLYGTIVSSRASFTVSGTVTGLNDSLVLQNNAGDNLLVSRDGSFAFVAALVSGENYDVTILAQPAGQSCSLSNETGTVDTTNITSISVTCADLPTYFIGGNVGGLNGSVVLQNNGGDNVIATSNGSFVFPTELNDGATYVVTVVQSPPGQRCTLSENSGTVATADISDLSVTCADLSTYLVGGNIRGLSGSVTLENNGGDSIILNSNSSFTFLTELNAGTAYVITVTQSPINQNCTISNNSGTVSTADINNVFVTCADLPTYSIGGNVSGLNGTVVLQNNGGDNIAMNSNDSFAFLTRLNEGAVYAVTVVQSPVGQRCTASKGSGIVVMADINNVLVNCIDVPTYSIGGNVSGLKGTVVLQNNGSDNVVMNNNGSFAFPVRLNAAVTYSITVVQSPIGQRCTAFKGSGTVVTTDINNVSVTCVDVPTYSIGGSVSGLNGSLMLQNNAGDDLAVTSDGNFVFATALLNAANYDIAVLTQPSDQNCSLTDGTGVVSGADITNVSLTCVDKISQPSASAASGSSGSGGGAFNVYLLILLSVFLHLLRVRIYGAKRNYMR